MRQTEYNRLSEDTKKELKEFSDFLKKQEQCEIPVYQEAAKHKIGIDRAKRRILLERWFKKVDFTTNRYLRGVRL